MRKADNPVYNDKDVEVYMSGLLAGEITSTADIYHAIQTRFPGIAPDQITVCVNNLIGQLPKKPGALE